MDVVRAWPSFVIYHGVRVVGDGGDRGAFLPSVSRLARVSLRLESTPVLSLSGRMLLGCFYVKLFLYRSSPLPSET